MNRKIFLSSFFISLLVLFISFVFILGILFNHFEGQIFTELKSEAGYIAYALENEGIAYIDNFDNSGKRITLISPDGTVTADTSADVSALDNHAQRSEVKDALIYGSGQSSRYSNTLTEKTLYYAVKLSTGEILRVSTTQQSVIAILLGLIQPLIMVIILTFILSLLLSKRLSSAIIKPINNIDLNNPIKNETYEELTPLLRKISTQRKTIDLQIKEAKQKQEEFKLITENMSEGLLVIDNYTNVLTYNGAALKLLEIDEIESGSVLLLNRTKGFRNVVETALGGDRAESGITLEDKNYTLIANPVLEDKKIIGAVIVIIDVTESVKREQLRREFTSNVSHELKTPLTSISGFAEMMKSGGTPEETVVDFSSSIYDEAQRLISLVNDIIKISELDEKSIEYTKENVNLYELSEEIIKRLKPAADKRNISMTLSGDRGFVLGVTKILDEVIYNLCDNAIKYNKDNGQIDIVIKSTENDVTLTVKDTGIGIAALEQDRIFERFYRVDKSHSKQVGGTGLGLSIVKHGAAFHNAKITLESTENIGTSITVTFNKTASL